jgi:hypothetical protein
MLDFPSINEKTLAQCHLHLDFDVLLAEALIKETIKTNKGWNLTQVLLITSNACPSCLNKLRAFCGLINFDCEVSGCVFCAKGEVNGSKSSAS